MTGQTGARGLEQIAEFLSSLRFRKSLFGSNTADVYASMQDLNAMYRDVMQDTRQVHEAEVKALEENLTALASAVERLRAEADVAKAEAEIAKAEADAAKEEADAAKAEAEAAKAEKAACEIAQPTIAQPLLPQANAERDYREKAQEMLDAIVEMQRLKETLVRQAEQEMQQVLSRTKWEAERIVKEQLAQMRAQLQEGEDRLAEMEKEESDSRGRRRRMQEDLTVLRDALNDIIAESVAAKSANTTNQETLASEESAPKEQKLPSSALVKEPELVEAEMDEWEALRARLMQAKREIEAL